MVHTPIPDEGRARVERLLAEADAELARHYPGDRRDGQPVHTVYVTADLASPQTPRSWGTRARALLTEHRSAVASLDPAVDVELIDTILDERPVQDLRIDFEDGYGDRGDDAEDADAARAGATLRAWADDPSGPFSLGVRAKGLGPAERRRGIRTLEIVLDAAGGVPDGFVFTVPKLRSVRQVDGVVALCEELERAHGLGDHSLRFELQIESPQAVVGHDGTATLARAIAASEGRCTGLHYGTYDYSAACGIAARHQSLDHPVADHAKAVMTAAAAQTGVWVSDGSTQVVPEGDTDVVLTALNRHFRLVTRSLQRGIYQGWDMHPGHLVTRWAATTAFFRSALPPAARRLESYLARLGGSVVDEPATAEALAAVVLRGVDSGAVAESEIVALAPRCTVETLRGLLRYSGAS
ncbi:DUF6986 family protein [Williamsia deligens]|uniref:DUF6986 family protein n=1 Tax=Williamsia deligens TaxID=321325 RepID=A0ABW3G6L9_9NOCA|nr:aldolase/citrate lyase family protein [Williamsia deligens]MCP2193485.1 HpcH/HpaI aldolase/citrate lyase family protein [Williamsia deligens]